MRITSSTERQAITTALRRAVAEVEAARCKFDYVTDPHLVDAAALELSAAEAKLRAALLYARVNIGDACSMGVKS